MIYDNLFPVFCYFLRFGVVSIRNILRPPFTILFHFFVVFQLVSATSLMQYCSFYFHEISIFLDFLQSQKKTARKWKPYFCPKNSHMKITHAFDETGFTLSTIHIFDPIKYDNRHYLFSYVLQHMLILIDISNFWGLRFIPLTVYSLQIWAANLQ